MALPGTAGEVTRNAVLLGFIPFCKIVGNWTPLFLLVNKNSRFPLSRCLQAAMPGPASLAEGAEGAASRTPGFSKSVHEHVTNSI